MVSLANASTLQMDSHWLDMIRKFVTETLQDGCKLNCKQLNRLLRVTWRLLEIQLNKGMNRANIFFCNSSYQNMMCSVLGCCFKFFHIEKIKSGLKEINEVFWVQWRCLLSNHRTCQMGFSQFQSELWQQTAFCAGFWTIVCVKCVIKHPTKGNILLIIVNWKLEVQGTLPSMKLDSITSTCMQVHKLFIETCYPPDEHK